MPSNVPGFADLLDRCERSAAHLELRDSYAPTDRFESWQRGERINWQNRESWWHPYDQLIRDTVSRGVSIRRARIVSEPVTEYIRWEHYVTHANVTAGEEVRWLPRRQATAIPCPETTSGCSTTLFFACTTSRVTGWWSRMRSPRTPRP